MHRPTRPPPQTTVVLDPRVGGGLPPRKIESRRLRSDQFPGGVVHRVSCWQGSSPTNAETPTLQKREPGTPPELSHWPRETYPITNEIFREARRLNRKALACNPPIASGCRYVSVYPRPQRTPHAHNPRNPHPQTPLATRNTSRKTIFIFVQLSRQLVRTKRTPRPPPPPLRIPTPSPRRAGFIRPPHPTNPRGRINPALPLTNRAQKNHRVGWLGSSVAKPPDPQFSKTRVGGGLSLHPRHPPAQFIRFWVNPKIELH